MARAVLPSVRCSERHRIVWMCPPRTVNLNALPLQPVFFGCACSHCSIASWPADAAASIVCDSHGTPSCRVNSHARPRLCSIIITSQVRCHSRAICVQPVDHHEVVVLDGTHEPLVALMLPVVRVNSISC